MATAEQELQVCEAVIRQRETIKQLERELRDAKYILGALTIGQNLINAG